MHLMTSSSAVVLGLVASLPAVWAQDHAREEAEREQILRSAQIWMEPKVSIEEARLDANPTGPDGFAVSDEVECEFEPEPLGGNTPKFDCELENDEIIRVKYGRDNQEIYAEVAASRLLSTLGFPTDDIYVVSRVRCFGCPPDPFKTFAGRVDDDVAVVFDDAIIERPRKGRRVETRKVTGWRWRELAKIDATAGGASRAQVDAFRVMAVFLSHWDNKPENQRLICLDEKCTRALAMVHDLGGTFGPFKVELKGWASRRIWADAATCTVSMRGLPYDGSSFDDEKISEEGRAFLAVRLARLSDDQIRALFTGARFTNAPSKDPGSKDVANWVRAFQAKRDEIVNRPPCPA
jgi:hypothetical protein